jgi:multimeric flavodoxin WrbA
MAVPGRPGSMAMMFYSAMKGAKDAGADTELFHLFDYEYTGCRSCFACKLENSRTNGICTIMDTIRPILEKAYDTDVM